MDRDNISEIFAYFISILLILGIIMLIGILAHDTVIEKRRNSKINSKINSTLTKEEILSYNIAAAENDQIDNLLKTIESFSKNEKIKNYRPKSELSFGGFFFTGKSFVPYFSNSEKKSSKITLFYITKKDKDSLEKDDIIKSYKKKWIVDTSKYEDEIRKEITLKDKENYTIDFDLKESEFFVIKNYIFKKVTLETYEAVVDKILINNENIDSYVKRYNFDEIKKEIDERYKQNKEFINKINEKLN